MLREKSITEEAYNIHVEKHSENCPAIYSHLSSVHLESTIASQVVNDALKRGIIFSGIVCDGDNKTHSCSKETKNKFV